MELVHILGVVITLLSCALTFYGIKYLTYKKAYGQQLDETHTYQNEWVKEQEKYQKLLSQKKSSETRLGQISENLIPFLSGCPYNPKDMHFMANPIDYLVFDLDEGKIVFLEVKSGNSRASKRQKTIKNIIQKGHVYYEELRINEKGVKVSKARNSK